MIVNYATAQVNYTQSFDDTSHGWTLLGFDETTTLPCEGTGSLNVNLYYDSMWDDGVDYGEMRSPNLGVSNGGQVTVTVDYKLMDYPLSTPSPTDSDDWGAIGILYSTSASGPWTLVDVLEGADHVSSEDCTTFTASFFPPAGQPVYVTVAAEHSYSSDDYYVFFDNFTATQVPPVVCSTAPVTSALTTTAATICLNENATITISEVYNDEGITFKWQSSSDNITYTDIAGQTGTSLQVSQTASTWYRAIVTCSNGNLSTETESVQIITTPVLCYCTVGFTGGVEPITLVSFGGINNMTPPTVTGAPKYEDFTATVTPALLVKGETYPIVLEGNTNSGNTQSSQYINHFNVYIDWNHNGNFEDNESYYIGQIQGSNGADGIQATANIQVPAEALEGATRMRVVKKYSTQGTACNTSGYGQVEDYTVNVQATNSAGEFNAANFRFFPNPVTDVLNLSADSTITNIEVYNIVGQLVLAKKADTTDAVIDMSSLTAGTYLVKVNSENGSKAVKVVKQ